MLQYEISFQPIEIIFLIIAIFYFDEKFSFFDAMARRSLWDVGLDYDHPTGHGIGAYLNAHEIPPLLSSRYSWHGMMKNMFTSIGIFEFCFSVQYWNQISIYIIF